MKNNLFSSVAIMSSEAHDKMIDYIVDLISKELDSQLGTATYNGADAFVQAIKDKDVFKERPYLSSKDFDTITQKVVDHFKDSTDEIKNKVSEAMGPVGIELNKGTLFKPTAAGLSNMPDEPQTVDKEKAKKYAGDGPKGKKFKDGKEVTEEPKEEPDNKENDSWLNKLRNKVFGTPKEEKSKTRVIDKEKSKQYAGEGPQGTIYRPDGSEEKIPHQEEKKVPDLTNTNFDKWNEMVLDDEDLLEEENKSSTVEDEPNWYRDWYENLYNSMVGEKKKQNGCNVTGYEKGMDPVASPSQTQTAQIASSVKLSGKVPVSIGTAYKANGGDVKDLQISGSDIDLYIDTNSALTILEAQSLGNDQFEVMHIDDGNNFFNFKDGDIVKGDQIRNLLIKFALSK